MNEQMYSIGPVMKAARKFKKLNQADVANAIGCSQSALSKMEHNLLIPSAPQWFLFARFTSIPPESLETGIIDRNAPILFNSLDVSKGFKIPKRYRNQRAVKVREVYPFLQTLEKKSPDLVKEFIQSTGIDPEFFLDFDNLVNFYLLFDLTNFMIKQEMSDAGAIKRLVEIGHNNVYWDHYGEGWRKLHTVEELLTEFVKAQPFFQMDFQLVMEGKGGNLFTLSYLPEYHLKQMGQNLTKEFLNFINLYRKFTIENLVKRILDKSIIVNIQTEPIPDPGIRLEILEAGV